MQRFLLQINYIDLDRNIILQLPSAVAEYLSHIFCQLGIYIFIESELSQKFVC